MKIEIYARISNGRLPDIQRDRLVQAIRKHEGKDVKITVAGSRKRSNPQNSYYWGVVVPMVHEMLVEFGNDVDVEEVHSFLKEVVGKLTSSVLDGKGKRLAIVKSSAALSKGEFEEYLERIRRWAAEFSVVIPNPNQHLEPPCQ